MVIEPRALGIIDNKLRNNVFKILKIGRGKKLIDHLPVESYTSI